MNQPFSDDNYLLTESAKKEDTILQLFVSIKNEARSIIELFQLHLFTIAPLPPNHIAHCNVIYLKLSQLVPQLVRFVYVKETVETINELRLQLIYFKLFHQMIEG